ncbi:TonB-dependent receptor [Chitinophaga caseinilytica]|uniref:TonB-dependent receptor n=1 Tax=Chitinophaga caseinilytica TaxID=2267521 RepID=UPI003C2C825E
MKHLLLFALLCCTTAALAQRTLSGTATDARTGQPLEGATIAILNGPSTITDASGRFSLPLPKQQPAIVQASFLGYAPSRDTLRKGTSTLHFTLSETGLFVKPVEITSLRAGTNSPFTKSELHREDIAKQNLGQDLPLLLNQLPSVTTNSDAGAGIGYTGLRVRGSDITRINVTVNGIPINDAESQGTFFVNMPDFASSVSSIQLQRGVGTSTNGAGTFGASLNLSTNEFRDKAYGEINASYGSFDSWKTTISAGSGLINDHFTADVRLSKVSSNGYIDRATSDLKSFYTSFAYIAGKSSIRLNVFSGKEKTYQAWTGSTDAEIKEFGRTYNPNGKMDKGGFYDNETDNYQQDHYQLLFNHAFRTNLHFNAALHYTRGKGYYENWRENDWYVDYGITGPVHDGDTTHQSDLIRQLWLDNHFYGGIFSIRHDLKKFTWTAGGGWNKYEGNHYGKVIWAEKGGFDKDFRWYDLDALKTDLNVYWKGEYAVTSKLKLFADLQYRHVNYELDGFRKNPGIRQHKKYDFFNPKGGATFTINEKQHVYASYAIGNKEPNRDDFEVGGAQAPLHETLRNLEAGYVWRGANAGVQANVYYMNYRNQLVPTGRINDVGAYARTNIPESYRLGIEVEGQYTPAAWFTVQANAAFSRNRLSAFTEYLDDWDNGGQKPQTYESTEIAFSPSFVGGATLTFRPFKGFSADLVEKGVGPQYLDNSGDKNRRLDGYAVTDLRLNYTVPQRIFRELGLQFIAYNLTDKQYAPNGYTYGYLEGGTMKAINNYFPMAGINFMAGVKIGL